MSRLSGKCDLYDHISGLGGWYDKDGNSVAFGQKGVSGYCSDILKDFEAFKEQTNGVIYQHKKVKVELWFGEKELDFIKDHCACFDYKKVTTKVVDKRCKDGLRENSTYVCNYWDKEYTLEQLKKREVWIKVPIHFNTLLDLLPYLSYTVSVSCGNTVIISDKDFVDNSRDEMIYVFAYDSCMFDHDKKAKADLYLEVCKRYFLYDLDNRTKTIDIASNIMLRKDAITAKRGDSELEPAGVDRYIIEVEDTIDYMHDIEFVWKDGESHLHWTSPKFIDEHTIEISKQDAESYLKEDIKNGDVMVKYVTKPKDGFPLFLK